MILLIFTLVYVVINNYELAQKAHKLMTFLHNS